MNRAPTSKQNAYRVGAYGHTPLHIWIGNDGEMR